jgi:hypothetical protein
MALAREECVAAQVTTATVLPRRAYCPVTVAVATGLGLCVCSSRAPQVHTTFKAQNIENKAGFDLTPWT